MANRCPDCDARIATEADEHKPEGCECDACSALCWREWHGYCAREPHDWRAEALMLRERIKELEASRG